MAIITLTTDLGLKDFYVASLKGTILKQFPEANIVDVSHDVPKFDIAQCAFIMRNAYADFPPGTIHILGVRPESDSDTPHVAVKAADQFFIGADNGMFSLLFDRNPEKIVELDIASESTFQTFPTRDIFVKAATHIARGGTLEVLGKPLQDFQHKNLYAAVADQDTIRGMVIYIDSYGNVITNITERIFKETGRGRPFRISLRTPGYDIDTLSSNYGDVVESERLALFGRTGFLEIAINIGHAANLLGLKMNDTVRVEFHQD